jgi:hypothetical protein
MPGCHSRGLDVNYAVLPDRQGIPPMEYCDKFISGELLFVAFFSLFIKENIMRAIALTDNDFEEDFQELDLIHLFILIMN